MDALVVDGQSEAMIANWLLMMLDRKNNEHTKERDGLWIKAKHPIFGSVAHIIQNLILYIMCVYENV